MDPSLALFAIDAGVKLGRKVNDILVNSTNEKPLILPVGDLYGSITQSNAINYFVTHPELTAEGGPYFGISSVEDKVKAYGTIKKISDDSAISENEAVSLLQNVRGFEQFKAGFGQKPVFQQFLGTVIEIGIDYLQTYPSTVKNDNTRKYISAFLRGIEETDFADGDWHEILSDFFVSGLSVFNANATDIVSDERVSVILGGMTASLLKDLEGLPVDDLIFKKDFFQRTGASLLKGALEAASENSSLYLGRDPDNPKKLINSVVSNVLKGLSGQEDLFSNEAVKSIVKSSLLAVSENSGLVTGNALLAQTIKESLKALSASGNVFSQASLTAILRCGLEAVSDNALTLIDTSVSNRVFISEAISAVALGMSTELGTGRLPDLLSQRQMTRFMQIIFSKVAENPQILLGENADTGKKAVLAQIIGSVSQSLGDNPELVASGAGMIELLEEVVGITLDNVDQFIERDNDDPRQNLLFKVLQTTITSAMSADDPRNLLSRRALRQILAAVLKAVSQNVNELSPDQSDLIKLVIPKTLTVASGGLKGSINSANLPILIATVLASADISLFDDDEDFSNLILNTLKA